MPVAEPSADTQPAPSACPSDIGRVWSESAEANGFPGGYVQADASALVIEGFQPVAEGGCVLRSSDGTTETVVLILPSSVSTEDVAEELAEAKYMTGEPNAIGVQSYTSESDPYAGALLTTWRESYAQAYWSAPEPFAADSQVVVMTGNTSEPNDTKDSSAASPAGGCPHGLPAAMKTMFESSSSDGARLLFTWSDVADLEQALPEALPQSAGVQCVLGMFYLDEGVNALVGLAPGTAEGFDAAVASGLLETGWAQAGSNSYTSADSQLSVSALLASEGTGPILGLTDPIGLISVTRAAG